MTERTETTKDRLPAPTCMFCRARLEDSGGYRIWSGSSSFNGMRLSRTKQTGRSRADLEERAVPIEETEEGYRYMMIWGGAWTDELIDEVKAIIVRGEQPWMCQKCGNRVCNECRSILTWAQGADIVHDDGHVSHCMIMPTSRLCTNPECKWYATP